MALVGLLLIVSGCGHPGPDPTTAAKSLAYAKSLRNYYDEVHGEYAQLPEADKAAYVKLCGSQKKADENWNLMKYGPGGRPASSSAPPSGGASR